MNKINYKFTHQIVVFDPSLYAALSLHDEVNYFATPGDFEGGNCWFFPDTDITNRLIRAYEKGLTDSWLEDNEVPDENTKN